MDRETKSPIDPKDLMALERATTSLIGTAISLIVLGFVVEKFELFLHLIAIELKGKGGSSIPQLVHAQYYNYLGMLIVGRALCSLSTPIDTTPAGSDIWRQGYWIPTEKSISCSLFSSRRSASCCLPA